jgi:hypothetical protein
MYFYKRLLSVFFILLYVGLANAQGQGKKLSENAEISLLTASPGDHLYSVFGHSAIRVSDPNQNLDIVFNYGTFDFDTPNFYLKFVRGKLLYKLSVAPTEYFIPEYQMEGRAIYEQVLALSPEQKQEMFNFLVNNSSPENAYYHYDFFYDNCATRIRDVVDLMVKPHWPEKNEINDQTLAVVKSHYNYEFDYKPDLSDSRTLRDMLQPYLVTMPWSAFGIDLALGLPADKVATAAEFMYLPDEMLIAFDLALLPNGSPLISERRLILSKSVELTPANFIKPWMVTWLVFLLGILSFWNQKFSQVFDRIYFSLIGLLGIIILLLWFFTDHITTKTNLNVLWAIPTHVYYIWKNNQLESTAFSKTYFRFAGGLLFLTILLWPWIPQAFNHAFFPLVLLSLIKSIPYMQLFPRRKN